MEFTEDEIQEYEEELEDTGLKALLIEQNALLHDMRTLLMHGHSEASDAPQETTIEYECKRCNTVVPEDELGQHASREHNAPPDFDPSSLFEEV